jgi:hypothetical protein
VEVGGLDVECSHLGIGDLDTLLVGVGIEPAGHGEAGIGGGVGDQLDDDLVADQRFAAPVLCNEGEQPMLDLIPLAAILNWGCTVIFRGFGSLISSWSGAGRAAALFREA